jgi:hypothetical protein
MLACLQHNPAHAWVKANALSRDLCGALDVWTRQALAQNEDSKILQVAPQPPRLVPIDDPHRAAALWLTLRSSLVGEAEAFAKGVHRVLTVAEATPHSILALKTPRSESEPFWLALIALGEVPGLLQIDIDGQPSLARAFPGDVLVIPRQARVVLRGPREQSSRWLALLLHTNHPIAL